MNIVTLGELKRDQTFCFRNDGRIYTFQSYALRNVFYHINARWDSHYNYDEYGCVVDVFVKERAEPLSINFDEFDPYGKDSSQKAKDFVEQKVQKFVIGYKDAGAYTRYLNRNFERYIVVWFDLEHNCLQHQMLDDWDDVGILLDQLDAKHFPYTWYD